MFGINRAIKNIRAWKRIARTPNAAAWMKIVEDVMRFTNEVNERKRPMLTQICAVNMSDKDLPHSLDIVSLWAGVGDQNPIERLRGLRAQIDGLRKLIIDIKNTLPNTKENEVLLLNMQMWLDCTK